MSFWSKRNRRAKRRLRFDQIEAARQLHQKRCERLGRNGRTDLLVKRSGYLRRMQARYHAWIKLEKISFPLRMEEGAPCPNCDGTLRIKPSENCSCHTTPPCRECETAPLQCTNCWEEFE